MQIKVIRDILEKNDKSAEHVRRLCRERGITLINVLGSPGAGKTSFIQSMLEHLPGKKYVIEGDIASTIDAEKIARMGVNVVQINTGGACHLIADTIYDALQQLTPEAGAIVFIENIGNLVCPSSFDLGESLRVLVSSAAEGDDKPHKYPTTFQTVDLIILSKCDVKDVIGFNDGYYRQGLRMLDLEDKLLEVSFRTGAGEQELADYLTTKLAYIKKGL
ncbi:MAG: hydrogenase nickel incorporation protein HypB [Negativicutes bacterium]|nr:hydrogenase nickel incorporation protein HypB [Negativicutes bacterium]